MEECSVVLGRKTKEAVRNWATSAAVLLAVSDRCSHGEAQDTSGPNLKQLLSQAKR